MSYCTAGENSNCRCWPKKIGIIKQAAVTQPLYYDLLLTSLMSLKHLRPNVISLKSLLHLGQKVSTLRTLLHLGQNVITFRPSTTFRI